jgi:7-cyano-7-deazaguanine synthase
MSSRTVLLSGGVDSAALLALNAGESGTTRALFVDYGQPAIANERQAAQSLAAVYKAPLSTARVNFGQVSHGEIPGRNALLVHVGLACASTDATALFIGIHAGTPYRDCTPEFAHVMQASLDFHRDGAIQLVAPFLTWSKTEVYAYSRSASVPLELTYSCEIGGSPPCGACPSCLDRELLDACT